MSETVTASGPQSGAAPLIEGVRHVPYEGTGAQLELAREASRILVELGVEFGGRTAGRVPWLVADRPFQLAARLRGEVERLGAATFALLDAVQELYGEGDATVRAALDENLPEDLRGRCPAERVVTFRLDITLERGRPRVTEIEEIYGNVGKMAAMQKAYGVDNSRLFRRFAELGISHVYVDDTLPDYLSELELLRGQMAESFGADVRIAYFSRFPADQAGPVWRFCKTNDLAQYPSALRRRILEARCNFINPLFHGYGTKAALALPFHPALAPELERRMGAEAFRAVREGFPRSRLVSARPTAREVAELEAGHKDKVLKVVDCPEGLGWTWGSRGVYFGDRSAARWRKVVNAAVAGRIPGRPEQRARYLVSDLVESDRFDVPFLHPATGMLAQMTRARIRLTPIFFRGRGRAELLAGHATFVNTSRKIHLGGHAVCAPLDWARTAAAPGRFPSGAPK